MLELLRSLASSEIERQKGPNVLWVDDVSRAQGNTVIATKQLCDEHPEGISLKTLAETMGVTAAAASVMVDLLVSKNLLARSRSEDDRRAVLVRLTPEASRLFEISDRCLTTSVLSLTDSLGKELLKDWQRILVSASSALERTVSR